MSELNACSRLLIPLMLTAMVAGCASGEASSPTIEEAPAPIPVEVSSAGRGDIRALYSATGALEALREAEVVARVAGEVTQVLVEEGDRVQAGQVLAQLDGDRLALEVRRAQARLRKAQEDYERNVALHQRDLLTAEALENLRYDVEALSADHRLAQLQLSYTNIRAPIDGVISERMIKLGNTLPQQASAFRITDSSSLVAYVYVPQNDLGKIAAGQSVTLRADALPNRDFAAAVGRISPVVDPATGTFKVTVEVSDAAVRLRPGMFARLEVAYDEHADTVVVPREAVLRDDLETAVFVVAEGVAQRRVIDIGFSSGNMVEVTEGLSGNETVVVVGHTGLSDGSPVSPRAVPNTI